MIQTETIRNYSQENKYFTQTFIKTEADDTFTNIKEINLSPLIFSKIFNSNAKLFQKEYLDIYRNLEIKINQLMDNLNEKMLETL